MAPPFVSSKMKLQKYFLSFYNLVDSTPIALSDVASSNNVARFYGISNAFSNQQPIEIVVQIINLIDSPSVKSAPLGFKTRTIWF